jgi:hypothetical protein
MSLFVHVGIQYYPQLLQGPSSLYGIGGLEDLGSHKVQDSHLANLSKPCLTADRLEHRGWPNACVHPLPLSQ